MVVISCFYLMRNVSLKLQNLRTEIVQNQFGDFKFSVYNRIISVEMMSDYSKSPVQNNTVICYVPEWFYNLKYSLKSVAGMATAIGAGAGADSCYVHVSGNAIRTWYSNKPLPIEYTLHGFTITGVIDPL